jgi:S1-C subfamily serine protease
VITLVRFVDQFTAGVLSTIHDALRAEGLQTTNDVDQKVVPQTSTTHVLQNTVTHSSTQDTHSFAQIYTACNNSIVEINVDFHTLEDYALAHTADVTNSTIDDATITESTATTEYVQTLDVKSTPTMQITGSGFIASKTGHIITAAHVVCAQTTVSDTREQLVPRVYVTLMDPRNDGRTIVHRARVVSIDSRADVAVLKIEGYTDLPALTINQTYNTKPGDEVCLIGNIYGLDPHSMATGVVRNPRWKDPRVHNLLTILLTTIPTANGCSGAPILDMHGHVVGLHSAAFHPKTLLKTPDERTPLTEQAPDEMKAVLGSGTTETSASSTEALVSSTMNAVIDVVQVQTTNELTTNNNEDARLDTAFGGGVAGPILWRLFQRGLGHDSAFTRSTRKCMPQFGVVPNTYSLRKQQSIPTDNAVQNRGYIVVALDPDYDTETQSLPSDTMRVQVGDILTGIEHHSVGIHSSDAAFGDATWFLERGDKVHLEIYRYNEDHKRYVCHSLTHMVTDLPSALDRYVNDPQWFLGIDWWWKSNQEKAAILKRERYIAGWVHKSWIVDTIERNRYHDWRYWKLKSGPSWYKVRDHMYGGAPQFTRETGNKLFAEVNTYVANSKRFRKEIWDQYIQKENKAWLEHHAYWQWNVDNAVTYKFNDDKQNPDPDGYFNVDDMEWGSYE